MRLIKTQFLGVHGLEAPNYFTYNSHYIEKPTEYFVRILCCNNIHWIKVSGWLKKENENFSIYDSLPRTTVNNHLGKQLGKMMTVKKENLPVIKIRVQKTQIPSSNLWGYFACAFATSLCFGISVESIAFNEQKLSSHWLKYIKKWKSVLMFPYAVKISKNNTIEKY